MEQCVGKFRADRNLSKWLGFDKYRKVFYGVNYKNVLEIFSQSIFGRQSHVLHSSQYKGRGLDSILAENRDVGVIGHSLDGSWQFLLFSIENKTLKIYNMTQGPNSFDYTSGECLLHSSSLGWCLRKGMGTTDPLMGLFHLKLNEFAKTFSLVFITKIPSDGFAVADENKISIISRNLTFLHVYDIKGNFWSIENQLTSGDPQLMLPDKSRITGIGIYGYDCFQLEDGKIGSLILYCRSPYRLNVQRYCSLCKLVNNHWEKLFTSNVFGYNGDDSFRSIWYSGGLLLIYYERLNSYIINTNVMLLKDLSFRKIFHQFMSNGTSAKYAKDILNFPTYLNQQYFSEIGD